ncbi:MAG: Uma2 family endonuclease [Planctomycetota bacterium]
MSTALRLNLTQYHRMVDSGAFNQFDNRIELIRGELRQMNPAGPIHGDLIDELTRWSHSVTTAQDCRIRIQSGISLLGVQAEDDSEPEPDVAWLRPRRYAAAHPTANDVMLVIEVADSSLEYDTGEKAQLYASAGLPEYWVVDVSGRRILCLTNPSAGGYESQSIAHLGDRITPQCLPNACLDVADLFAF